MPSCASSCTGRFPPLRIGAVPTALAGFVPAAVNALRRERPGAVIVVEEGMVDELPGRLSAGELHVAVTFQDASAPRRELEGVGPRGHRERAVRRCAGGRSSARAPPRGPARRSGGRAVDCGVAGRDDRPRLSRRGLRAAVGVADARAVRHPLHRHERRRRHAGASTPGDAFAGTALRPIDGPAPVRDVYVLVPPGRRHPLVEPLVRALRAVAQQRVRRQEDGG